MSDEVITPPTDRDLDIAVSQKMGFKPVWHYPDNPPYCHCKNLMYQTDKIINDWELVPNYSTDIGAAWELVEKARLMVTPMKDGRYFAGVIGYVRPGPDLEEGAIDCYFEDGWAIAETAPLAICRAFLALPD